MTRRLGLCMALCLAAGCSSTPTQEHRSCYHKSESIEKEIGYCEAVRSGNRLYVSGTVGQGEMPAAVQSVYKSLEETLQANGLTFADVVEEHVFTTDIEAFKKTQELRKTFYKGTFPAATWVQVERLYLPQFVVEIELIAEYPR